MTAATVLLWRHGQTDYNSGGRLQGQVDIPLNEIGRAQAEAAAEVLARVQPAQILSSDLTRAHATAQALAGRTGVEVGVDERLRERGFGQWEGLTHPEIAERWPEQFVEWENGRHPEGVGAETRGQTGRRIAEAVAEAAAAMDGGVLVVTSHGAAISSGITTLLGLDAEVWRGITGLGNCHWSVLRPNDGSQPAWRVAAHNVGLEGPDFTRGPGIR
ncbi:histidine phosphatase family protein [Ruania albidiflava]|uniref:histidine phosphatase family protein n=1 Tax=Ruania albidiflava TaxID=366586 RepID=UPI0003B652C6|nr:histidine phosphatase family protein [Ruania albidiflava]